MKFMISLVTISKILPVLIAGLQLFFQSICKKCLGSDKPGEKDRSSVYEEEESYFR